MCAKKLCGKAEKTVDVIIDITIALHYTDSNREVRAMEPKQQEARLNALLTYFIGESADYRHLEIPERREEKRNLLRSLMNVRMPRPLPEEIRETQDAYLREDTEEKGIVDGNALRPVSETLGSEKPAAEQLVLWQGDITRLAVDAIVNAANSEMLGCFIPMHNCIDNCIHTAAGLELRADCKRQMDRLRIQYGRDYEQPTALPMLTDAYNLPAKKVIHVVGPIVSGALTKRHEEELADCYRNVLSLAADEGLKSLAFCCLSTGVFHFPGERAAEIAVETVRTWLTENPGEIERVIFNVFQDRDKEYYEAIL